MMAERSKKYKRIQISTYLGNSGEKCNYVKVLLCEPTSENFLSICGAVVFDEKIRKHTYYTTKYTVVWIAICTRQFIPQCGTFEGKNVFVYIGLEFAQKIKLAFEIYKRNLSSLFPYRYLNKINFILSNNKLFSLFQLTFPIFSHSLILRFFCV